jgi:hypothetical protein
MLRDRLGQSYRTPREAVIDEYGAIVRRFSSRGKSKNTKKNLFQCHLSTTNIALSHPAA